jgi:hypothetical protein
MEACGERTWGSANRDFSVLADLMPLSTYTWLAQVAGTSFDLTFVVEQSAPSIEQLSDELAAPVSAVRKLVDCLKTVTSETCSRWTELRDPGEAAQIS